MNHRLERLVLGTVLLAALAYGVADENPGLLLFGVVGIIAAWSVVRARGGRALPLAATIPLTLAAVGYAMIRLVGEGFKVGVFSEFVLALIVVKLVDRRSARDNSQLLLLSVFLVVGAILTSNRLLLGLLILLFVPVFGATVVRHQIESTRQAASPWLGGKKARGSVQESADLRRLVWFSTMACLAISIVVFVVMPRGVGMQAFGAWGNTSLGQVTSFTDEVELGRGGLISQSSTPVLDLEVRNAQGESRGSASEVFYLRGAVLDQYADGRWTRERGQGSMLGQSASYVGANTPFSVGPNEPFTDIELRVTLRNVRQGEAHLFSVWRPIKFETLTQTNIKHDRTDGTIIRDGPAGKFEYIMRCLDGQPSSFGYRAAKGQPPTFDSEAITRLTQQILRDDEPPIDPDPMTRPVSNTARAVGRIRSYLVENYAYSLETRTAPPGQDPIEWFLFGEDKRGHCEYFAAAMAAMCRSVGINSRVVTGYVATEWNAPTGHYIVRESNAHAWVEVEVQPGLWQPRDPTPTTEFYSIHEPSQSVLARVRRLMDTAEYAWINSVVGFSRRGRAGSSDSLSDGRVVGWAQRVGGRVRTGGVGLLARAAGAGMIAFALCATLGLLGVWLMRGPWRSLPGRVGRYFARIRAARGLRRGRSAHESLRLQLLSVFDRLGRPKPDWRPLGTHAQTLDAHHADDDTGPTAGGVVQTIYRGRFGGEPIDPEAVAQARADLRSLARAARSKRG